MKNILGYTPSEIINKNPFDFFSREEAIRVNKELQYYISNKLSFTNLEDIR